jgi:hypothetical protein
MGVEVWVEKKFSGKGKNERVEGAVDVLGG